MLQWQIKGLQVSCRVQLREHDALNQEHVR